MKKLFLFVILIASIIPGFCAEDIECTSELSFTANRLEEEPDPNNNEYLFALFGSADGVEYKLQIDYHSENVFGTFTDEDFDLSGSGKYHNFIRVANNDMKFWNFKHLDVTVSEVNGGKHIDINGVIQKDGEWCRVLVTGDIAGNEPGETIEIDLGNVAVIPNEFFGYILFEAANAEYTLSFGIGRGNELKAGTYYSADLIRPELVHLPSDAIEAKEAQLEVTEKEDGEFDLCLEILSTDNNLYRINMYTGAPEVIAEETVVCATAKLHDYSDIYNIFSFEGLSDEYYVLFSIRPEVINESMLEIPENLVDLSYTQIVRLSDSKKARICKASGKVEVNSEMISSNTVYCDLLATDGTLYHVTLPVTVTSLPDAEETTVIDCGDWVGRLDFSGETGWMGLVLGNEDADVHVSVKNNLMMKGMFTPESFEYEDSYVTTYDKDGVVRFFDVEMAELHMDSIDNHVRMELDVITRNNHKYCFRARLVPMKALSAEKVNYSVDSEDADMVAFRMVTDGEKAAYRLQFQRADEMDEYGEINGNGEIWDFSFAKEDLTGIAGEYSYSAGTLVTEAYHFIYENDCEILLGTVDGRLVIDAVDEVTIDLFDEEYHTHIYKVNAEILANNGITYELAGENILLCVDYETGEPVEFAEGFDTAVRNTLIERGMKVKKVLRDGIIILDTPDGDFSINGSKMK